MSRYFLSLFSLLLLAFVAPVQGLESTGTDPENKAEATNISTTLFKTRIHSLYEQLDLAGKGLQREVFEKALIGYINLKANGELSAKPYLTIVDFGKSSVQKRLWVIDLHNQKLVHHTLVAHGRNTGEEYARNFSNTNQSFMSSLGFYVTDQTYQGRHGLSLKLRGMDENFNTNAMDRAVVMHGAEYVSEAFVKAHGRLGRSHGCPAVPVELHEQIINTVKDKTCLYVHYPAKTYSSKYLNEEVAMQEFLSL